MQMQPVESSQIEAIGHDPESNTLRVRFKSGGEYEYADVPAEAHQALMAAPSVGSHFHKHVRNAFAATRVG